MNYCTHCGSVITGSQLRFCPTCGKEIDIVRTSKNNKIFLFGLLGILLLVLLAVIIKNSSNTSPDPNSPAYDSHAKQSTESPKDIIETGFYLRIGLSADELVHSLGQPSTINQTLYVYDDLGSRQMYGFKNGAVYSATYILTGIRPISVPGTISDLMTDLESHNFSRISDYQGIKRYSNDDYEMSIVPIKTEDGMYNVSLMAFHK